MNGNTPSSNGKWTRKAHSVYTRTVAGLPRALPIARFVVADTSMQPALAPGDRVLVNRWARVQPGDIAVVRDPDYARRFLVKRVAERTPTGLVLRADNPNVSRDSRIFGPVAHHLVLGKVVWRYLPAARRGRIEARRVP